DQRLAKVFVGEADGLEHRTRRRARGSINQDAAVGSERILVVVVCHGLFISCRDRTSGRARLMICITARAPAKSQVGVPGPAPPRNLAAAARFCSDSRPLMSHRKQ